MSPTLDKTADEAISWRGFAALFALLLAVVLGVGVWLYRIEEADADGKAHANLEAIARLKVDQVAQWRGERLAEAVDLMSSTYLIESIERWFDQPNAADQARITRRLRTLVENRKLLDVMLVDASGKLRLNFAAQPDSTGDHLQGLGGALHSRRPVLGELHRAGTGVALDAYAPLVGRDGRTVGALILHNDASRSLFSMLNTWPVPSRTGETVLVRHEGDGVLFLNKLRRPNDPALSLRLPLSRSEIPAVRAVQGRVGVYEGPDYRGVPVLSVLWPVPDSPWFMVAKMDAAEAYADWYRQSRLLLALLAGVTLLIAGGLLLLRHSLARNRALLRAEMARRDSERQADLIIGNAADGILVTGADGRIKRVNPRAEALFGYSAAELIGQEVECLVPERLRQVHAGLRAGFMADPRAREMSRPGSGLALIAQRRDGSEFPFEVALAPMLLDGERQVVVTLRDISQRRVAEETLRKLSSAVEQSSHAIVITNDRAEIEYVNQAFIDMSGYSRVDVLGQNPRLLQSGETPQATFAAMYEALRQGRSWRGEVINRRRNGEVYYAYQSVSPIHDAAGELSHYVSLSEDVSEKKRIGRELDRHRHHLEELVATRTSELVAARMQAERLAQVKSEFLANMSHEIRTPMNAVLGMARIGLRDNEGREARETFGHILSAGQHLLGVINDILDFSRIEAGKLTLETRPFRLAATLEQSLGLMRERAQAKGLELTLDAAADLPEWVLGDGLRVEQVLLNLLGNALKFTERGAVSLVVRRVEEDILFRVADSGIGMSPEQLSRLFGAFEQADASTTRQFGGSGLGLAISRNLARLMGGDIGVESEAGVGSVFTLHLPLPATAAQAEVAGVATGGGPRLAGLRVLAAEDVDLNRLVLEDLLESEGATVVFAENGRQVLDRLAEHGAAAFDVVLMDVQMPVMDGHEATRRLCEIAPGLPVIGLTAHALAEERDKCLASGMVGHVTKPIDPNELIAAILGQVGVAPGLPVAVVSLQAGATVIDWAALNTRFNSRSAFIDKLLASLLDKHTRTPDKLRQAALDRDARTLAFLCHSLKGLSGNLAAPGLQALARDGEAAARLALSSGTEANLEPACEAAQAVAEQMQALLQEVQQHLNG